MQFKQYQQITFLYRLNSTKKRNSIKNQLKIKKMRTIYLSLLLTLCTVGVKAQLLWKITGNGLTKPSYMIGTYHLAPVSFTDSIQGLKQVMEVSEQVYGEVITDEMTKPENVLMMQAAMMLPEGKTLSQLFNNDEMTSINNMMKELMGTDMTNPIVAQQLDRMTPQALQMQLTILMYLKNNPGFNPLETFDGYFQKEAKSKGKPVGGLETIEFQTNLLYKSTSLERQSEQLLCLANNKAAYEKMADALTKAFFSQDIKAIKEAVDMKLNNSCDGTEEEDDRLIYSRNANWAELIPGIMKDKSTLFVVGAAHLIGEKGMINLLRNKGYNIEGIGN